MNSNPAVEKALKLHQEAENAKGEAIEALLQQQKEIGEQLKALGYGGVVQRAVNAVKRTPDPNRKCPKCGQTGHDGRFHRKEGAGKKEPKKEAKTAEKK